MSFVAADEQAARAENYDDVRLSELIAKSNRASPRPILFADPTMGERRVSGRFRIGDADALAERIAALFDLAVDRRGQQLILRPR
jgi:transmembrane sensor